MHYVHLPVICKQSLLTAQKTKYIALKLCNTGKQINFDYAENIVQKRVDDNYKVWDISSLPQGTDRPPFLGPCLPGPPSNRKPENK
jgi:hypothetical protein